MLEFLFWKNSNVFLFEILIWIILKVFLWNVINLRASPGNFLLAQLMVKIWYFVRISLQKDRF